MSTSSISRPTWRSRPQGPATRLRAILLVDWVLVATTLALSFAGVAAVYAATRNGLVQHGGSGSYYLNRDLLNLMIAVAMGLVAALVDYRLLATWAPVLWVGVVLALLAVLTPLGRVINGAHAWFAFGPVQLEPSEFAKLVVILVAAAAWTATGRLSSDARSLLTVAIAAGVPILLVLAEPALGIAIVLVVIVVAATAFGGLPGRWLTLWVVVLASGVALVLSLHLLKPYQQQRFTAFTNPSSNTTTSYQLKQSEIAIGSGGLTGRGFLAGAQTNGGYVPEQQTDFVFSVIGEEAGFAGSAALLAGFGVLLGRAVSIASHADDLGRVIAGSIAAWFAAQVFINVGMAMGIMPVTGVPLPFVSYGGSALFVDMIAVGILVNISRQRA
jgi:rod shape determining protein RodA